MSDVSTVMAMNARKLAIKANKQIGNLFIPETITKGFLVNTDGTLLASASYATSDFIPVEANKQYFVTNVRSVAFYSTSKILVPGTGASYSPARDNFFIKAKSNGFVRVTSLLTNMENNILYTVAKVQNPIKWLPKIWHSFGDSITEQQKWQPYVVDVLGFDHTSKGVGGN